MLANISHIKNRVHILPFVALPDFASNNLADFGKSDVARQTEKGTAMTAIIILIVVAGLCEDNSAKSLLLSTIMTGGNPFFCVKLFDESYLESQST